MKNTLRNRLIAQNLLAHEDKERIQLKDGRHFLFADEPDIAFCDPDGSVLAAIEVKGGIDPAAVLERVGASIKSLSRIKQKTPKALTILVMQAVAVTAKAQEDIAAHQHDVNHWVTIEAIVDSEETEEHLFSLLGI